MHTLGVYYEENNVEARRLGRRSRAFILIPPKKK